MFNFSFNVDKFVKHDTEHDTLNNSKLRAVNKLSLKNKESNKQLSKQAPK